MRQSKRFVLSEIAILVGSLVPAVALAQTEGLPPVPPESEAAEEVAPGATAEEDVQVLARGPLHEAFAAPIDQDPQPGELVDAEPPQPIDEIPPEVKPEGENVEWLPGYWAWDDDADRYIWISGVWRTVPPGREWIPGYWAEGAGGHRWVSGYWGGAAPSGSQVAESVYRAAQEAQEYVAPPPESVDVGPISPQPSDQHFWIPGCWIYADAGYRWRPGYWYEYQPNWVWVPDHYVWTPAGCLFVNGYWDYPLQSRGMLFSPVYFSRPIYTQPYYYYRPHYAVDLAHLALHLFVHPRNRYYYYGDYYGAHYAGYGYRPWFHLHIGFGGHHHHRHRHYYDPLLAYYGTHYHRRGIDYIDRLRGWHRYYDRHEHHRPPRRFDRDRVVGRERREHSPHRHVLARSVDDVRRERRVGDRRVVDVDRSDSDREQWRRRTQAAREVARARRTMERESDGPREGGRDRASRRVIARDEPSMRERPSNAANEASREDFRRALARSRELARAGRDEEGSPTRGPNTREGRDGRVLARGQQPDRNLRGDRSRESSARERVMRVDPAERIERPERTQSQPSRNLAEERQRTYQQRWRFGQDAGPQGRASVDAERAQQARESARRAQQNITARQRSLDAARDEGRLRSSGPRDVTGPSIRREPERSAPAIRGRDGRGSTPSRQPVERFQRPTQRTTPQAAPRQIDRARSFARERAAAPSRSIQRSAPPSRSIQRSAPPSRSIQRSAPQARPQPRSRSVRPSFKANQLRSGRGSSPAATKQRGSSARKRAAPSGGNAGRGRGRKGR